MSAGGLSYDCLTTNRKVTLPSVEMWGRNKIILRDPNKGIFTRRKDKVGQTQSILLSQEDSGDRIAENINVYARGVNPMVSVSYDNYGNNAGSRSSVTQGAPGVKLPLRPDVFYPPVFRQEQLLPLSRLPRNWFYALTNPVVPNIISQMSCPETRKSIHENIKNINVTSNIEYHLNDNPRQSNLQKNTGLNLNVKNPTRLYETNAVSDHIQTDRSALGQNPKNLSNIRQFDTSAGIAGFAKSNIRDIAQSSNNQGINENKMLYNAFSNISGNKNVANIRDQISLIQNKAVNETKDNISATTNLSGYENELSIQGPTDQLARAVSQKNYAIPVQTSIKNQYNKQGQSSTNPSTGINNDLTNINANTNKTSSFKQNAQDMQGFSSQKINHNPLHTDIVSNTNFGYTKQGSIEYFQQDIHPEQKLGSWVVAPESMPYKGSNIDGQSTQVRDENKIGSYVFAAESMPYKGTSVNMSNNPKESLKANINTEAYTQPTSSQFWRNVEPIISQNLNVKEEPLNIEAPARKTMIGRQYILPQDKLNREYRRNTPLTFSEATKTSPYTRTVDFENFSSGRIDPLHKNLVYESRPSAPVPQNIPGLANDIPVRVRDLQNINVTSSIGHDNYQQGLDAYSSSQQRSAIDDLYKTQSFETNKKYIEQMGELGVKQDNPRSMLMIQNKETVHDRTSFGYDVYESVQSRDGSGLVNPNSASSGQFEALGNSVPRFGRMHDRAGDMPTNNDFMDIKKKAVNEFADRYQGDQFRQ